MVKANKKSSLYCDRNNITITLLIGIVSFYKKRFIQVEKTHVVQKPNNTQQLSTQFPAEYSLNQFLQLDKELYAVFQRNVLFFDKLFPKIDHYTLSSLRKDLHQFIFSMNVPAVNPKNFDISVRYRLFSANASKQSDSSFYYQFIFPDTGDTGKITAKVSRGVLEIIIPKTAKAPSKKIIVQEK